MRTITHPPDWHGLVVADVLLNNLTTGLFLVAAVADLTIGPVFRPVAAWAYPLALMFLTVDLACLVLDLGDPLRFHHMLRVFKPGSPMSLGTWFLTVYSLPVGVLAVLEVATMLGWVPNWDWLWWVRQSMLVIGVPTAFGSAAYKGVLFSVTAQPGWRDARWLGAYFVGTGLALGAGIVALLAELLGVIGPTRLAFALLLAIHAVPLALVGRELGPALRATGSRWWEPLAWLAATTAVPLALLGVGWVSGALLVLIGASWWVRSVIIHIPQVLAGHGH